MTDAGTRRKFEALVAAAFADGYLADAEKVVLQRKAARMNINSMEMNEIIGLGQQRKLSIGIPATAAERDALLEDLIEVVVADGRVEAPEYSLLARFAETLKISLPDLRLRVNRRMQSPSERNTKTQTRPQPQPSPPPRKVEVAPPPAPPSAPPPASVLESVQFMAPTPPQPRHEFPKEVRVADVPPVTLQLLKQIGRAHV